jgi:steroid delta-isomerase-like uncharacterized protein
MSERRRQPHRPAEAVAEQVQVFYEDVWNRHRLELVPEVLHPEVTFRGSLGSHLRGHDQFCAYVEGVTAALGDYRCVIEQLVTDDRHAAVRLTFSGVHRGMLLGVAPSGHTVSWPGAAFFAFDGSKAVDVWALGDLTQLRRQLGGG